MPTYQYRCNDCEYEFEEFQSMTEPPITVCPHCKGHTRRLISGGAGFLFKGSGFYITDYRSPRYKADQRKETPDSSTPSPKASRTADSTTSSKKTSKEA